MTETAYHPKRRRHRRRFPEEREASNCIESNWKVMHKEEAVGCVDDMEAFYFDDGTSVVPESHKACPGSPAEPFQRGTGKARPVGEKDRPIRHCSCNRDWEEADLPLVCGKTHHTCSDSAFTDTDSTVALTLSSTSPLLRRS